MNDMVTWLRRVLDDAEWTAREAPGLLSGVVLARVEAERGLLDLHKQWPDPEAPASIRYCAEFEHDSQEFPCDTLRWLAYGHRFDAPGWQHVWTPDSVQAPT